MSATKFATFLTPELRQKMMDSRIQLRDYVFKNARQGDIQNIIDTIDEFSWNKQWFMNIGDQKGKILDEAVEKRKPKIVLELGTFLGYSSLRIISHLSNDAIFYTIELDAKSAEIARSIFEYAGVADRIKLINGDTANVIPRFSEDYHIDSFDFIFIDHLKTIYLRDLKLLETAGLITSGTMIVADNVICPGAPDYLEYVRSNKNYTTTFHEATLEYHEELPDGIEISIRK